MISHFTHPHPLTLSKPRWRTYDYGVCVLCQTGFNESDETYSCKGMLCDYYVHKSCAQSLKQISHPLHPHHKLNLFKAKKRYFFRCSACWSHSNSKYAYNYYCDDCHYGLDLKCAALVPIEMNKNQINHQHPLVLCNKPNGNDYRYTCHFCGEHFEHYDRVYVCQKCHCLLHESCAALPSEMRHPFHPEHPLTLLPRAVDRCRCHVCDEACYATFLYHCSLCRFSMDVHCVTLKPKFKDTDCDANQEDLLTQPIPNPHPHPLIQCDSIKNFRRHCFGCNLPFKDFIYACFECGVLLHKFCADLPPEIVHPFHPQHPLILGKDTGYKCQGCQSGSGKLVYSCKECRICFDLKCAQAKPHFIMISEVHKHALAYFDFKTRKMRCNICRDTFSEFFFRCVECDFNIHDHCYPLLPEIIKHECHCDPLTLSRYKIKDLPDEDEAAEFYCNACESLRKLSHPTYYCAGCHFVAHVHCVISEILPYLDRESIDLANKVDHTKLDTSMITVTRRDMSFLPQDDEDTYEDPVLEETIATAQISPRSEKESMALVESVKNMESETSVTTAIENEATENGDPASNIEVHNTNVRGADVDPVLQELDARIAELQNELDQKVAALTAEIANLKERRAQHVASANQADKLN